MAIGAAWQPLSPEVLDGLPDTTAVFEIGSLVRSVLYIGGDPNEGLRACVARALENPRLRMRARCVRWELTSDPRARAGQLLSAYRAAHDGALPAEQPRAAATVRSLMGPVAPEAHPAKAPVEPTTRGPLQSTTFLRVRRFA